MSDSVFLYASIAIEITVRLIAKNQSIDIGDHRSIRDPIKDVSGTMPASIPRVDIGKRCIAL